MHVLHHHQQQASQADEEQFKTLVREIKDYGIFMLDTHGRIKTWNKGAEHMLGYKASEVLGKPLYQLYFKESYKKYELMRELETASLVGRSEHEEWWIRKNGSRFYANEVINSLRNEKGVLTGYVKIIRDITSQKNTEEMLANYMIDLERARKFSERERAKDEALLDSIGEGVIATDDKGRIMLVNTQAQAMLGLGEHEVIGKSYYEAWSCIDARGKRVPSYKQSVARALKAKKKITISDHTFSSRQGKLFPVNITASPVFNDKKVVGAIAVFRNISKEREAERAKSEFVSLASHQLRTPLTAIKLFSEILETGGVGAINKDQADIVMSIKESNEKMIHLVNDLLNVSRIEAGNLKIHSEPIDLKKFIKEVIHDLGPVAAGHSCKILCKTPDEVVPFQSDPVLLRQVLNNLINNAIQYSPNTASVCVCLERTPKGYLIKVTDKGIGVPKKDQARIFEKLYRADNAIKVKSDGSGLGLYLCKMVIEALGGKIWLESRGIGSTFFVSLVNKK